jgi:type IV pilus assembly protein PilE
MFRRMQGVTLLELMVVIVIVALLASIAIPSYRSYMVRSHRTEATTALLQIRSAQEKFFLQNGRYINTTAGLTAAPPAGLGLAATTPNGYYTITVGGTVTRFTAQAVPAGGQAGDEQCQQFNIDADGGQSSAPDTQHCWR